MVSFKTLLNLERNKNGSRNKLTYQRKVWLTIGKNTMTICSLLKQEVPVSLNIELLKSMHPYFVPQESNTYFRMKLFCTHCYYLGKLKTLTFVNVLAKYTYTLLVQVFTNTLCLSKFDGTHS